MSLLLALVIGGVVAVVMAMQAVVQVVESLTKRTTRE
jgi:uncharacterized ion transporter superfamily protein YfcC